MNDNVSIEEVLNNSFATIYDVLKIVDSSVNDVVINNLNNSAAGDEIMRLQQFNVDYIKAMKETKALQSNIMSLFNYVGKDLNELIQQNEDQNVMNDELVKSYEKVQEVVNEPSQSDVIEEEEEIQNENTEELVADSDITSDIEEDLANTDSTDVVEVPEDIAQPVEIPQEEVVVPEAVSAEEPVAEVTPEVVADAPQEVAQEEVVEDSTSAVEVTETPQEAVQEEVAVPEAVSAEAPATEEVQAEAQPEQPAVGLPVIPVVTENEAAPEAAEQPVAEASNENSVPNITFNNDQSQEVATDNAVTDAQPEQPVAEQQESASVVLPTIPTVTENAPAEAVSEQPQEAVETPVTEEQAAAPAENANSDMQVFEKSTADAPRAIVVTNVQFDKIRPDLETKKALLNAKGFFGNDANLEQQLVQNGLLEGSVEDKKQQVQQLMEEAKQLYPTDPNASQEKMAQVAQLNEEINSQQPQQMVA